MKIDFDWFLCFYIRLTIAATLSFTLVLWDGRYVFGVPLISLACFATGAFFYQILGFRLEDRINRCESVISDYKLKLMQIPETLAGETRKKTIELYVIIIKLNQEKLAILNQKKYDRPY